MVCAILKFATASLNSMNFFLCFRNFDRSGLNFKGIKLKISQIVGLGYNLCKFQIDTLQIEPACFM